MDPYLQTLEPHRRTWEMRSSSVLVPTLEPLHVRIPTWVWRDFLQGEGADESLRMKRGGKPGLGPD